MCYAQEFPATVEEWMESNKIVDTEHIYTNGSEMVPIFRMRQWFQHVATQKEPHWIPVTERLPEEDDYRPCYGYEDGAVWWLNDMGLMGLGWYYPSTGKWAYYNESSGCEDRVGSVIAWMPLPDLPEPYKEGKENGND